MNPMLEIARRRYTAKHYDPAKPLSDEDLHDLLEIMRLAPSSVNIQPWHFYVLRSEPAMSALAPAVKDFNVERIRNASAIIIIALERDLVGRVEKLNRQETLDGRFDEATIASGFDKVDEILGLEKAGRHAVIGIALGHHSADDANAMRPKSRFPFDEVVTIL